MKAARLIAPRSIAVTDLPDPEPGPGQVLLSVKLAGICGSDHSLYQGRASSPLPVTPGHEAVAEVEEVGPGASHPGVGRLVVIQPNFPCRTCRTCARGHENVCPSKIRLGLDKDGVFAEKVVVPAEYIWTFPAGLPARAAVLAEPLAVAAHGLNVGRPGRGDRILVLGAGVIGLLTLQMLRLEETEADVCEIDPARLALARDLGAGPGRDSTEAAPPDGYDLIYETSGAPAGLAEATRLAAPGGRIVMLGLPAGEHPLAGAAVARKELRLLGSMIYRDEFPQVLELLGRGRIETEALITGQVELEEIGPALTAFGDRGRIKTLVKVG
jgi:L-iditol 2-dehydrogenase